MCQLVVFVIFVHSSIFPETKNAKKFYKILFISEQRPLPQELFGGNTAFDWIKLSQTTATERR